VGCASADARALRLAQPDRRAHVEGVPFIAQEQAPTGVVVEVVDQVHLGGIYDITVTTQQ